MTREEPQDEDEDEDVDLEDETWLSPAADSRVLDRMRTSKPGRLTKYFWGMAYLTLLPSFPVPPKLNNAGLLLPFLLLLVLVVVCVPSLGSGYVILLMLFLQQMGWIGIRPFSPRC